MFCCSTTLGFRSPFEEFFDVKQYEFFVDTQTSYHNVLVITNGTYRPSTFQNKINAFNESRLSDLSKITLRALSEADQDNLIMTISKKDGDTLQKNGFYQRIREAKERGDPSYVYWPASHAEKKRARLLAGLHVEMNQPVDDGAEQKKTTKRPAKEEAVPKKQAKVSRPKIVTQRTYPPVLFSGVRFPPGRGLDNMDTDDDEDEVESSGGIGVAEPPVPQATVGKDPAAGGEQAVPVAGQDLPVVVPVGNVISVDAVFQDLEGLRAENKVLAREKELMRELLCEKDKAYAAVVETKDQAYAAVMEAKDELITAKNETIAVMTRVMEAGEV